MLAMLLSSLTVAGDLSGMLDAHLTSLAERHWLERRAQIRAIDSPAALTRRQAHIRDTITASLGGWPERTPLAPRITGGFEREGYRVEKLIFESLPGFPVTANVYVPTDRGRGPFPAVLGTAGHSEDGKAADLYQRGWIGMVRRGMIVLAYDPPGQGERSQYWDAAAGKSRTGIGTREHTMAGLQCLLTGTNIARYEIWDGMRAIDYLLTRADVDPSSLAVAGNSGGGTQAAYLAALEPRLAAAAPSCYLTSWESMWLKLGPQDAEQNFHGFISSGLDFGDFLLAFAPRPIKMMTAIRDFFPIEGARSTFREAADVFGVAGAREKIDMFEFDDTHGWSKPRREATYRWFEQWLNHRKDEGLEAESKVETGATLRVTASGQVSTEGRAVETVQSMNARLAGEMFARRAALRSGINLRDLVATRLVVPAWSGPVKAESMGELGRDGYRIERILFQTEPGISVPALLFVPSRPAAPGVVTLWLDPQGKAAGAEPGGPIEKRVLAGETVCAIDVRGWGESAPSKGARTGYGPAYQTFMRAYLLGRSMMGLQVADVLNAASYLRTRGFSQIRIAGHKAAGGALAIYAGMLDPRIAKVTAADGVPSYLEIARMREHEELMDLFVHGVLADFDFPDLVAALGERYSGEPRR
jgi:cephalosporin-C deacetylase-like acetyl esterase